MWRLGLLSSRRSNQKALFLQQNWAIQGRFGPKIPFIPQMAQIWCGMWGHANLEVTSRHAHVPVVRTWACELDGSPT